MGEWEEKWGLKLTTAKVEVEVEAALGKNFQRQKQDILSKNSETFVKLFIRLTIYC